MKRMREFIAKYIPIWVAVSFIILALSLILLLFSALFPAFADFLNGTLSQLLRRVFAAFSGILPFSLFEVCLILALPLALTLIIIVIKSKKGRVFVLRVAFSLLGVIFLLYSLHILMLGVGYRAIPLSEKMELDEGVKISHSELFSLAEYIKDEVNALESEISFSDGESRMGYGLKELSKRLSDAYERVEEKYPFISSFTSRVKPVALSSVMSDMGIMGIYGYFTGEANINISYPDYNIPYTAAHEMAHQRGVARENEANFVAYLVCIESEDPYIRYSGYLSLFEYLGNACYYTDRDAYYGLLEGISEGALSDMRASARITREHQNSFIYKMMDKVNDLYLKSNGTEGSVSYSYVVRLAVAYYKGKIN